MVNRNPWTVQKLQSKIRSIKQEVKANSSKIKRRCNWKVCKYWMLELLWKCLKKSKNELKLLKDSQDREIKELQKVLKQQMDKSVDKAATNIKRDIELDVQKAMKEQATEIEELQQELQRQKQKVKTMSDVLHYHQDVMQDMARKMDAVELNNSKKSVILSGLSLSDKKKDRLLQVQELFNQELCVYPQIEDTYTIGERAPKSVIITLATMADKFRLLEAKQQLNKLTGYQGKRIFLNEYLPAAVHEKKQRERDITRETRVDGKKVTEYTKNGFKVGSTTYKKRIQPPTPCDLLGN